MIEILHGIHEIVNYTDMKGFKLYHNKDCEAFPVHWHTEMEIILPIQSGYQATISDITTHLEEGDIYIIPPGELHSLNAPLHGERLIILIDFSFFSGIPSMDALLHSLHPFLHISPIEHPTLALELRALILDIEEEYSLNTPFMASSIYSLLMRFFTELGRSVMNGGIRFPNITSTKQQEYVEKFMTVCNYVNEHCTENLNAETIARQAGFSKFHFLRLFKQFTNFTFYDYLTRKRIQNAEQLLIQPHMTITEVAMHSGFNSLPTFNRTFKAYKKCTPTAYKTFNTAKV